MIPPALATISGEELPNLEAALRLAEPDVAIPLVRQGEVEAVSVADFGRGDGARDGLS